MARLPPSRHPLHCSLRIPDFRARNDSPLRRSCHHALPAICLTRRLSAQTIRHCGLNATFRTRLQQCGGDWWPLSSPRSRVAHAAPLATDTEICDTVRLGANTPPTPPVNVVSPRAPTFPCRGSLFAAGKTLPVFGNFFPFAFHGTFLFTRRVLA